MVGVPGRADTDDIEAFVDERDVAAFEHVIDPDGELWSSLGIRTQPAFAFINDDGTIETHVGRLGEESLTERIDALLAR